MSNHEEDLRQAARELVAKCVQLSPPSPSARAWMEKALEMAEWEAAAVHQRESMVRVGMKLEAERDALSAQLATARGLLTTALNHYDTALMCGNDLSDLAEPVRRYLDSPSTAAAEHDARIRRDAVEDWSIALYHEAFRAFDESIVYANSPTSLQPVDIKKAMDALEERIRREALRPVQSAVIKALAEMVRMVGPDKQSGPEVIYREPLMEVVVRLRNEVDALAQPQTRHVPPEDFEHLERLEADAKDRAQRLDQTTAQLDALLPQTKPTVFEDSSKHVDCDCMACLP